MIGEILLQKQAQICFAVDTNVFMACEIIQSVRKAEDLGKAQYKWIIFRA